MDFKKVYEESVINATKRHIEKSNTDATKQYIFDIENPLKYKSSKANEPVGGIAVYSMTEDEFADFKNGKTISPKSIYEQFGMEVIGDKRFYGNEDIEKNLLVRENNEVAERDM